MLGLHAAWRLGSQFLCSSVSKRGLLQQAQRLEAGSRGGCLATFHGSISTSSTCQKLPIVFHHAYSAPKLPDGHRFPMGVFQRIRDILIEEGVIQPSQVHRPGALPNREQLLMVHEASYVDAFCRNALSDAEIKRIGFGEMCLQPVLVERTLAEIAGTLLTAKLALQQGLACNTAGGTHHAFPNFGSGFCILNDLAVTSRVLLQQGVVSKILIVDLDVHQGDGTAVCLQDMPEAFTLSMHGATNFPARKQNSDLDVPLPDGMEDAEYLRTLGKVLPDVLASVKPDLVLYDAGVDPHKNDALGRLSLSSEGLFRRDMQVTDTCLAAGVPVAGVVGGGYSPDLNEVAQRHCLLHRAATEAWSDHRLGS
ncbi:hypothetical protein WJX74_001780 [Apatococcus lobatus]|uniref:Histone deacetylase domain-containing protein n=1 Tax=Apatococcus lobatus TaxID=904363 RepID=A0AAW1R2N9_9CHLO